MYFVSSRNRYLLDLIGLLRLMLDKVAIRSYPNTPWSDQEPKNLPLRYFRGERWELSAAGKKDEDSHGIAILDRMGQFIRTDTLTVHENFDVAF